MKTYRIRSESEKKEILEVVEDGVPVAVQVGGARGVDADVEHHRRG